MDPGFINGTVTRLVPLVALIVYWLTKRHDTKNAATIIVMDIRYAEQLVFSILKNGVIDISTKDVLLENNWPKYKHLLASDFSHDDFAAFNRFFDSCVEMPDARKRMREIFYSNLNEKTRILKNKIFGIDNADSPESQAQRKSIIDKVSMESYVFEPKEPRDRMLKHLQS